VAGRCKSAASGGKMPPLQMPFSRTNAVFLYNNHFLVGAANLCASAGKTTPPFGHPSVGGEFFSARKDRHGFKIPLYGGVARSDGVVTFADPHYLPHPFS